MKTSERWTSSEHKMHVSRSQAAAIAQYIPPFKFTEISGHYHKCISPVYVARALYLGARTANTVLASLIRQLARWVKWPIINSPSSSNIKFGHTDVQSYESILHFDGANHVPKGTTVFACLSGAHLPYNETTTEDRQPNLGHSLSLFVSWTTIKDLLKHPILTRW